MVTTLFIDFTDAQGQLTEMEPCQNSTSQAIMVSLVTGKNEENPSKNEGTRVVTTFFPL